MRAVPRSAARTCISVAAAAFGFVVACGPRFPPPELNVAYGGASGASASTSASASAPTWKHLPEMQTWSKVNGRRFTSKGHYFGRLDADVFVNAIAAPAYSALHPGSALPEGGIIVKVHRELNGDAPGPMLAIE